MGRALVALVACFVAVGVALPVALNTYRPPHEQQHWYEIVFTDADADCTETISEGRVISVQGDDCPDIPNSFTGE